MDSSRCVRECRGEMIHSLSLFRQQVNSRPTMTDDDGSRLSALFGLAQISGFDPPLTTVCTTHTTQPLSPLLHPPVQLASS